VENEEPNITHKVLEPVQVVEPNITHDVVQPIVQAVKLPIKSNTVKITSQVKRYKNATHKAQGQYIEGLALQRRIKSAIKQR
jgi:hypothetical protein